jgi:hypothetical protein
MLKRQKYFSGKDFATGGCREKDGFEGMADEKIGDRDLRVS